MIDNLAVCGRSHDELVQLGFERSVCKRADAPYRGGRSRAWLKHKARHEVAAQVRAVGVSQTRGRIALCELHGGGGRCWASAGHARQGDDVTLAYSRRDAGGQLREARVITDDPRVTRAC